MRANHTLPTMLTQVGFRMSLLTVDRANGNASWMITGTGLRILDDYTNGPVELYRGMAHLGTFDADTIGAGIIDAIV